MNRRAKHKEELNKLIENLRREYENNISMNARESSLRKLQNEIDLLERFQADLDILELEEIEMPFV